MRRMCSECTECACRAYAVSAAARAAGCGMQAAGCRLQAAGCRLQARLHVEHDLGNEAGNRPDEPQLS